MMSKAKSPPGKECPPFPDDFDRDSYSFRDDFSFWMSALGRRVALMRRIKEFQEQSALRSECSEQQSAIISGWLNDIRIRVMNLIQEPIPLKKDDFFQHIMGEAKFADRTGHLEQHPPISNRVIFDEIQSASKLKDQFYRNIFEIEIDKLVERESNQQEPSFGISSPFGQENAQKDKALNTLTENFEIWRADIQMPSFAGDFVLKVNLFYDDKQLCKAFSDWLKETRKQAEFPIAKRMFVTLKKLQDWHGMRVLPYMDLWLYQLAFDVDFDEIQLARLLFRCEDDTEASGDKEYKNWLRNTRKCAESLIQQSVFLSLRYKTTPSRSDQ